MFFCGDDRPIVVHGFPVTRGAPTNGGCIVEKRPFRGILNRLRFGQVDAEARCATPKPTALSVGRGAMALSAIA
jgi:hypothetical protein